MPLRDPEDVVNRADGTTLFAGAEGETALQSDSKIVTRSGATSAQADIDIDGHDLADSDFETGVLDVGGTSAISILIESESGGVFEVIVDFYDDNGNVVATADSGQYAQLQSSTISTVVPVFSDRLEIRIVDRSGAGQNTINGTANINIGSSTSVNAELSASDVTISGAGGDFIEEENLDAVTPSTATSLVTYISRALNSQSLDEFVSRVTDSTGTQIDPLTQGVTSAVSDGEIRTRLLGLDESGQLAEGQVEALDTPVSGATTAQVTYLARALASQSLDEFVTRVTDSDGAQIDPATEGTLTDTLARDLAQVAGSDAGELINEPAAGDRRYKTDVQSYSGETVPVEQQSSVAVTADDQNGVAVEQQTPVGVEDSDGGQIDPDVAPEYPNKTVTQHDLIADGDLTIGPVSIARSSVALISAYSVDGNSLSVSVTFEDGSGNTLQTESASSLQMENITDDYSRIVRKGGYITVTYTDTSGAAQNHVNAFVDAHR